MKPWPNPTGDPPDPSWLELASGRLLMAVAPPALVLGWIAYLAG